MKDTIYKDFARKEIYKYHIDVFRDNPINLFIPMTFEIIESKEEPLGDSGEWVSEDEDIRTEMNPIRICYDLTEMDSITTLKDGFETPYLAVELIRDMEGAMDHYILPNQYLVDRKLLYVHKNGRVKLAYVPKIIKDNSIGDPGKIIRANTGLIIKSLEDQFPDNAKRIYNNTMEVLLDNKLGMDSALRRIEKLKEEAYYQRDSK